METTAVKKETPLVVAEVGNLKDENHVTDIAGIIVNMDDPTLNSRADNFMKQLFAAKDADVQRSSIDSIGENTQAMAGKSEMLKTQIRTYATKGADGGNVANALLDLKNEVEKLDPNKLDLDNPKNYFIRALSYFPIFGTSLKKYFEKYMTSEEVIAAIIKSLEGGRETLIRDNKILSNDQQRMKEYKNKLIEIIKFMKVLDKKLEDSAFTADADDPDKAKYIREELLFPHRQRMEDMLQTLLVNQQGILTIEVIIRNNRELVRGVNRALRVTIQALEIAVSLALALAHQKIVLEKIQALNKTTNTLIAGTAERLKTQGATINKEASSTSLDMEVLKKAFDDIHTAMEDISKFRLNALPKMANDIDQMQTLASAAEKSIQKMEAGSKAQAKITVDFDGEEFKVGA